MPEIYKIKGGVPLVGEITPVKNKNAIVAILPASLLSDKDVLLKDIPNTTDVLKMYDLMRLLGTKVETKQNGDVLINSKNVNKYRLDKELGILIRASITFAGPLLARFGIAEIPLPGGCVLGQRSIHAHIDSFKKVGVKVSFTNGYARFEAPKKVEKDYFIWQNEASVTATSNISIYAAGIKSKVTIMDAACEPHIAETLQYLSLLGATINGIHSNRIEISGTKTFKEVEYEVDPDHIDICGLIVASAVTKGRLVLKNAYIRDNIEGILQLFRKFNIGITISQKDIIVDGERDIKIDLKTGGFPLSGNDLPKFIPRPWPGYPIDALPMAVTLACKLHGKMLMQNWMYETGLDFVRQLNAMGANIFMADPQRVIVTGPIKFKGGKITAPGIIQATMAIFLAALADDAETEITGVEIMKRRYPDVIEEFKKLGAKISLV